MRYSYLILTGIISLLQTHIKGQDKSVPYDLAEWNRLKQMEIFDRTVTNIPEKGGKAVLVSEAEGIGVAWLKGVTFSNGRIEVDIKGKDVLQKSFTGIAFHGINDSTFDAVYFRAFNFRTDDPVRHIHAVQYISHPQYTWYKLREEKNGMYEKAITPAPDPNEWFHASIVIHYPHVEVFVNDNRVPSLVVDKLNDRKSGKLGLWVGNGSGGSFANLKVFPE